MIVWINHTSCQDTKYNNCSVEVGILLVVSLQVFLNSEIFLEVTSKMSVHDNHVFSGAGKPLWERWRQHHHCMDEEFSKIFDDSLLWI